MKLSAYTLKNISAEGVIVPEKTLFDLPEKVLQFGTGMLLRGLPDFFIDKANRLGLFNGRVVVVKTTDRGNVSVFERQDGLYTLCVRGIDTGRKIEENIINSSISRVLGASTEWERILECAHNQHLQVIISNTTEVGIQLVQDDMRRHPPASFPGKLLAFLHERFRAFGGSDKSGMIILPTELIPDNGKKLESIVLELAHLNGLSEGFIEWLEHSNYFCNSLVDRIVTGMPGDASRREIEEQLGYTDELLTVCEDYRLWAIEGNEHVRKVLSFAAADEGVIIADNIELYRELKLRLLNGTHTLSCGVAFLAGIPTVREAMENGVMFRFIEGLMKEEIAPSLPGDAPSEQVQQFAARVLDRFRNPHIAHFWKNITLNYTAKMKTRCIPLLVNFYRRYPALPERFALGFAAYLAFMKPVKQEGNEFFGERDGKYYLLDDEYAGKFYKLWQSSTREQVVKAVLSDSELWGEDLAAMGGFESSVSEKLAVILSEGMTVALDRFVIPKSVVS